MPLIEAETKRIPSDFQVTERLRVDFSNDGEHAWLWVEKIAANTEWTARQLARFAGCPVRDVGYAGLKDRQAVTRQWFSVRAPRPVDWSKLAVEGVRVLAVRRHRRKLRRGAHQGNRFRIAVRGAQLRGAACEIDARLALIRDRGIPNFFGAQRFGRDGANLKLASAWCAGGHMSRHRRSLAISTARSAIFNDILRARVADRTWNTIIAGDTVNLDGSRSVFSVETPDDGLEARCRALDIHPTATLWGRGAPLCAGDAAALERSVVNERREFASSLETAGVKAASRSLRLVVRELQWEYGDDVVWLDFELAKGGYATAVLTQLLEIPAGR